MELDGLDEHNENLITIEMKTEVEAVKNLIISGEIQVHDFMNNNHCDDTYYIKPGISVNVINDNTTESGGTALFTVKLDSEPTANVTIPISSDNVSEGTVSVSSLTFTSLIGVQNKQLQ